MIAPDGRTAALFRAGPNGTTTVYLLNLTTGATRKLALSVVEADESVAWSPDSRWLFAVVAGGKLDAFDTRTGKLTVLSGAGTSLPQLHQLAIRTTTPTKSAH